jgi:hypothetical protein
LSLHKPFQPPYGTREKPPDFPYVLPCKVPVPKALIDTVPLTPHTSVQVDFEEFLRIVAPHTCDVNFF